MAEEEACASIGETQALLSPRADSSPRSPGFDSSPRSLSPQPRPRAVRRTPCRSLVTALVTTVLVAASFTAFGPTKKEAIVVRNALGDEVTELRSKACSEYPYLKFKMPHPLMHNNLANKGPDSGAEGMVYDTIDLGEGAGTELGHQVIMVVNATSEGYRPFSPRLNGMQGKYGSINLQSGSSIDLRLRFYDRRSGDPYELPEAAFTFFDLDTGDNSKSVESVTFDKNYKRFHLTPNTEVKVEDLGDRTRFSGSTMGTGDDNPLDPMRLTHQQKNRAVTLTFEHLQELRVTLSASAGTGPRFFTFVSRPSLMCAVTVQEGYVPPLDDIIAEPPLQQSVQSDYDTKETFGSLLVRPGQQVQKGDPVFTAKQPDGSMKTYTSPIAGTVKAAQTKLAQGDDLNMKLDNKTVVIVERPQFEALAISFPWVLPGGPAFVLYSLGHDGMGGAPNADDLVGYWCGPGCAGGPGHEGAAPGRAPGGAPAGQRPIPQVSKDATFVEYLKLPGDSVSPGEPIMTVKDGDRLVAVTSPELGIVKSRKEGMKLGDALPHPGPIVLMDIRPEVTGDATFVEYLKKVGEPVAKGDPLMKVKNAAGQEVVIKAKTVGVVKHRQEDIKRGDPIATAKDHNLMTIGPIPALTTDGDNLKSGIVSKKGQELVEIKAIPGDLVKKGDVVAVVKDIATGKETNVLSNHDGLVTAVNDKLKPGDPIDRTADGNLVTTGKFSPLPVKIPDQWGTNTDDATAGPESTFVKYNVKPGDLVEAGDTVAVVKKADGTQVPVKADRAGVVAKIQSALQPGMKLQDVMQDKNLATIKQFDKLPPLPVDPEDQWPSNNDEADNGPHCKFVEYHVQPGDVVHTGDPIATVEKPDGTFVDILADKPGVVKAIQDKLELGNVLDDTMEDSNLATIEKLPPLEVKPGEAGCCMRGTGTCPSGAPKDALHTWVNPAGAGLAGPESSLPWAFEEWNKEVDDPVEKGDTIAVLKNTETGEEKAVLASKSGNVVRRQEALRRGDVIDDVMQDKDLAVIGKFLPLNIGLTEAGVTAPVDAIFVKWYHVVGEKVTSDDNVAQVRLGVMTASGRRLASDIDIPSPGTGTIIEEMDLKPGQSIGQQSLSPTIAKLDIGWPWWLKFLAAVVLLCCILCCFYAVMRKPKPPYKPMPPDPVVEVERAPSPAPAPKEPRVAVVAPPAPLVPIPPAAFEEPKPDGLRLDFEDENGVVRTVYARWRPLGIKHNFVAPIVAHSFTINSYAKQQLGVKDGWKLSRIGNEELHDNPNFEEVNGKLHEYMKDFPLWPLPVELAEGREGHERKTFKFVERPIGIEFKSRAPIEVEKVFTGSPAAAAGVQVGWDVIKIGEFEVGATTSFKEVMDAFKEGVTPLDDFGRSYKGAHGMIEVS